MCRTEEIMGKEIDWKRKVNRLKSKFKILESKWNGKKEKIKANLEKEIIIKEIVWNYFDIN